MFRSAAAALILAVLPSLAGAQEARTHTVALGETLWEIAARYYDDGYLWTRIVQANPGITDPDRIVEGMELVIPDAAATQVTAVQVTTEPMAPAQPGAEAPPTTMESAELGISVPVTVNQAPLTPTTFRREPPSVANTIPVRELDDVPAQDFYGAPWLIPVGTVPARSGAVTAFVTAENVHGGRGSAHPYERLNVTVEGASPAVGSRLQALRLDHDIRDVGRVIRPTGVLLVEEVTEAGVVARVEMQFDRLVVGDLVRPLPPYTPRPADAPQPVSGGTEATILGFAIDHALQSLDDHAFLDLGGDDGVSIGDEFVVPWTEQEGGGTQVQGRVKVVAVLPDVSTARIIEMENPVFVTGTRLAPSRRVP